MNRKIISDDAVSQKAVFRHGTCGKHPRLAIGISLTLFLAACGIAVFKGGDWIFLTLACGLAVFLYLYLVYTKLEIWESGFSHQDLSGNHTLEFAQIDDVLFETVRVGEGYAAPELSVRPKGGTERMKVPIGMFPIRASALLFASLERHGIPIRLDGSRYVESTMRQIREAQSELVSQGHPDAIHT